MRTYIILLVSMMTSYCVLSQQVLMPAHTRAAIRVIQKDLNQNRDIPSQHVLDYYPIYQTSAGYYIAVLGKVNSHFNKQQAIDDGLEVGAVIGSIVSMRMPVQWLQVDITYPGLEYIEVAEKIEPQLDQALIETRANLVHQGYEITRPYTGKDVIVGVVDWGFDYSHPMFFDTTLTYSRILAAWDQVKVIGTPPPGFSHGAYYDDADKLATAKSDTFSILSDYHGTHVAGIAAGSGGGTQYRGMAFESDLLFSQMRNDVSSSLDAFQWMYDFASVTGRRLVINNSWGGYRTNPLDGTSLMSQAIDAFSELGVLFVFSAGNNGDINFHLKKTFNQDSVRTRIMGFDYSGDNQLWGQTVTMWGEPAQPFSAQLRILSATNTLVGASDLIHTDSSPSLVDTMLIIGLDTIFYNFITDDAHPLNGRPQMTLNVRSTNQTLKKILYAEAESGTVHFWNTRLTKYGGGNWGFGFTAPSAGYVSGDKNYGIGHPALTNSVITTAAHQTNFHLTAFSSYGPRMDEVMKPDISAPGQDIISSFNSYSKTNFTPITEVTFNGREYEFVRLSGTSMSAPMVTGAAALLLEANPLVTPEQVKNVIAYSARTDAITGLIPPEGNTRWGHGKLDVYYAIQIFTQTSVGDLPSNKNYLFPNPADDVVYVTGELNGNDTFRLSTVDGKTISIGHFDGSLDVGELAGGLYFLSVEGGKTAQTFMFVIK